MDKVTVFKESNPPKRNKTSLYLKTKNLQQRYDCITNYEHEF